MYVSRQEQYMYVSRQDFCNNQTSFEKTEPVFLILLPLLLSSGPVGDDDLWYHHIPGMLHYFFPSLFSVPPGASRLTLRPCHLPLRPSQLALRPFQLALRLSQLAPRLTVLDLRPSQRCSFLRVRGSPSLLRGPPDGIQGPPSWL